MLISLTEHTAKCVGCERFKLKQADTSETGKKKKKVCGKHFIGSSRFKLRLILWLNNSLLGVESKELETGSQISIRMTFWLKS